MNECYECEKLNCPGRDPEGDEWGNPVSPACSCQCHNNLRDMEAMRDDYAYKRSIGQ